MKLTKRALIEIDNLNVRLALASKLQFSETWIRSLIRINKDNGPLTTVSALNIIKQETGLQESEILTEANSEVEAER